MVFNNRLLKVEFKRSFLNIGMYISLITGLIFVFCHSFIYLGAGKVYPSTGDLYIHYIKDSFIDYWIIMNISKYSAFFINLLPLLVVLPYGLSLQKDMVSGNINNIKASIDSKKFYSARFWATFLSGGIVAVNPLIMSLLINLYYVPLRAPAPEYCLINANNITGIIFFKSLFIYIFFYLLVYFFIGGILSISCLIISTYTTNFFLILFTPFIFITFTNLICSRSLLIAKSTYIKKYVPNNILDASKNSGNIVLLIFMLLLLLIICNKYFYKRVKC